MTAQSSHSNQNGNHDGELGVVPEFLHLLGISRSDMRWIARSIAFTITMVGLYFSAQAIPEIITAIRQ